MLVAFEAPEPDYCFRVEMPGYQVIIRPRTVSLLDRAGVLVRTSVVPLRVFRGATDLTDDQIQVIVGLATDGQVCGFECEESELKYMLGIDMPDEGY